MSTPLTVAWKYQSFHVCGVEEMSRRRAEVVVGWALVQVLSKFCSACRRKRRRSVACTEQMVIGKTMWLRWLTSASV